MQIFHTVLSSHHRNVYDGLLRIEQDEGRSDRESGSGAQNGGKQRSSEPGQGSGMESGDQNGYC
jgi:hypothetical protein